MERRQIDHYQLLDRQRVHRSLTQNWFDTIIGILFTCGFNCFYIFQVPSLHCLISTSSHTVKLQKFWMEHNCQPIGHSQACKSSVKVNISVNNFFLFVQIHKKMLLFQGLTDRLRGLKLPSNLLKKVSSNNTLAPTQHHY